MTETDPNACAYCGRTPADGATITYTPNEPTRCEWHPYGLPETPRIVPDGAVVISRGVALSLAGPLRNEARRTSRPEWAAVLLSVADLLDPQETP